ncbi:MAG TPA: glycosyltransferase, partial [Candidatus Nitrosotenuis sp.]|nr:glycosyltransferase [Candidatus Nitrosotenuis sp.]
MPRVAVFNLSETRRDPRVRRTAAALVAMGCAVTVYGVKRESDIPREEMEGFALVRVDPPPSEEPGEMAALERFCPQAAALLHRCDPEVVEGRRPPRGTFGYRLRRLGVGLQRR